MVFSLQWKTINEGTSWFSLTKDFWNLSIISNQWPVYSKDDQHIVLGWHAQCLWLLLPCGSWFNFKVPMKRHWSIINCLHHWNSWMLENVRKKNKLRKGKKEVLERMKVISFFWIWSCRQLTSVWSTTFYQTHTISNRKKLFILELEESRDMQGGTYCLLEGNFTRVGRW